MLDIRFDRENPDAVKENIRKKFQDEKLPLVDECIEIDAKVRALKSEGDNLRSERNSTSTEIGSLMREKKVEEANAKKPCRNHGFFMFYAGSWLFLLRHRRGYTFRWANKCLPAAKSRKIRVR